ncbi:MAG: fused response regulator/phosphatase [Cereibacter sphaeroides]|uniref:Fused response regulator/phosphatase n=1 Tax=Cereibacter sphaeroides TaxID=1063 RepID=A0A2W5UIJ7_CERSP|nr:MAG: fused response regulator/phosphatase [Cereibacter sphaeroides]
MVVDDSAAQRKVLALSLARWGYSVTEAASGEAALALCEMASFDLVLSDWMMPGMSGLDLCRALRATPRDNYLYFILLTSKSDKTEVADGLDGGADDFLSKPVNALELRARLRAGERLLAMQEELVEKNRLVASTLGELQTIYDSLDRDLIEARKLQQTLMRDRHCDFGSASVWALLRPSGHVGGDLVGWLRLSRSRVALYAVDVSGHGVASAMMTARLAGLLTTRTPYEMPDRRAAPSPDRLAEVLNRMMIDDMQIDQYFTMAYAEVDLKTGEVQLVQAGHPHPVILRRTGQTEEIGQGGLPVGLIADARYEIVEARLQPGDRLFLVSDGVTECVDQQGHEFGEEGLSSMLQRSVALGGAALLEALVWDLQEFSGGADFRDDVSGVLFEYRGA